MMALAISDVGISDASR